MSSLSLCASKVNKRSDLHFVGPQDRQRAEARGWWCCPMTASTSGPLLRQIQCELPCERRTLTISDVGTTNEQIGLPRIYDESSGIVLII